MPPINIAIGANIQGVQRQMTTLQRYMTGVAKQFQGMFSTKGATQGVTALTKQMQALTKATDAQVQKVKTLQQALQNVNQQMGGAQGSNLQSLQAQQKLLQRQFQQSNSRLGVLQQMGTAASQRAQAGGGGTSGAGGSGGSGGGAVGSAASLAGRMGSGIVGELAPKLLGPLAGILTVTGIASIVGQAFQKSAQKEKTMADLMPRLLGPGGAGGGAGFDRRLGKMGLPLGFTTNEGLGAAETLSAGGFKNLGGLQKDTKTSMQMARFFGLDLGAESSMLAEGGRMGAFKPGDAKKFATVLATEIAKTGLGPRAQEVQEATLMLLNNQLRTQATSNPAPVMALQAMFNKTGLPAFTGTRGAGMVNQINDSITNPRSDAAEALNQQVFLKMGAKGVFQMEEMKERGLSDPRYLPTLMRTILKGTHSNAEARFLLKAQTGMTMLQSGALQSRIPGGLAGISEGNMGQWQKVLKENGLDISGGAKKAMGQKGNELRMGEATVDAVMLRIGDIVVDKVAPLSKWLAEKAKPVLDILDTNTKGTWDETKRLADYFIGAPVDKALGGALSDPAKLKAALNSVEPMTPLGSKVFDWTSSHVFGLGAPANLGLMGIAHKFGLTPTSGLRPGAHTVTGKGSLHSRGTAANPGAIDFGGTPEHMDAAFDMLRQTFGDAAFNELIDGRKGMIKNGRYYSPGHFPGKHGAELQAQHMNHLHASLKGMGEGDNHLTIHVQHDGIVGPHAQAQVDHAVGKAIDKSAQHKARSQPNKRNMRQ